MFYFSDFHIERTLYKDIVGVFSYIVIMKEELKIQDLEFDDKNFNKGTEYGKSLMEKSLSKFGAGRSILIDKNNRIIAGNKTAQTFGEIGGEDIVVVETNGDKLIAVKRTDIDLGSKEGRELALADNQTAKVNIDFDFEVLEDELDKGVIEEWGLEIVDEKQINDDKDLSDTIQETYEVIVTCNGELQQEEVFYKLNEMGYECRVLTL